MGVATLYLGAVTLIGLAVGALLRHPAAIGGMVTLLFLAPQFAGGSARWVIDLSNALPGTAIRRLVSLHPGPHAPSISHAYAVIACYPLTLMITALIVIERRDA